ncbi:PREDICTED: ectonucleoside triphosphate diphosphohydrolase 2, partial [Myotis brandtii]|uniref:ectonucleoside triphosphate diphosphohydrolase 2 n=1 Tax=Myotis brandtii TaxID=109478 RepID=UPI000704413D
ADPAPRCVVARTALPSEGGGSRPVLPPPIRVTEAVLGLDTGWGGKWGKGWPSGPSLTPEGDPTPCPQYGIVLDAGSSHTSMFIYKWPADKENDTGIVGQHSSCDVRGGGISSYADNPSGAGQSLVECLEQALRDVPRERHAGTPLYLGATAGMRLSTQLTFEAASPTEDPANEVQLRLYGQQYRVYTHSFLCYGRDQILQRLLASVLQTRRPHPCWPRGYSTHVLLRDVYESPCTAAQRPQTFNSSDGVSLSGSGDPSFCRGLVSGLFNLSSCPFSRCSFNGVFQPPVSGDFIAFSAFFYTVDFLRTAMGLPVATLQQLEDAAVTVCSQTWSELQARAPEAEARLPNYCPMAMFLHQLLSQGYRFDEHAFSRVTFQKKVGAGRRSPSAI